MAIRTEGQRRVLEAAGRTGFSERFVESLSDGELEARARQLGCDGQAVPQRRPVREQRKSLRRREQELDRRERSLIDEEEARAMRTLDQFSDVLGVDRQTLLEQATSMVVVPAARADTARAEESDELDLRREAVQRLVHDGIRLLP